MLVLSSILIYSLRCQSLLYLKLYKMRRHELKECQKIIYDHIQKASVAPVAAHNQRPENSPNAAAGAIVVGGNNTISPTPSPAGSEGSRSSGYTSSGEQGRGTVHTPPLAAAAAAAAQQQQQQAAGGSQQQHQSQCLSVPQSVMQMQHQFCNYLSQCHELWEMADVYAHRGHCAGKKTF